jgi:ribosomal protein S18 acetylase RimI-like enzyme
MTAAPTTETLEIVPATEDAVPMILDMLDEASDWLARKGFSQWQAGTFNEARIARSIRAGEVYLAKLDGQVVGTITLAWSNAMTWGDMTNEGAYVSRLTVKRSAAGRNIGKKMLEWAEQQARARDRKFLRLDCGQENDRLLAYYDKAGFQRVGHANIGEWTACLFEKPLT